MGEYVQFETFHMESALVVSTLIFNPKWNRFHHSRANIGPPWKNNYDFTPLQAAAPTCTNLYESYISYFLLTKQDLTHHLNDFIS